MDTLAIPKLVKKLRRFSEFRSQNLEIRSLIVHIQGADP